MCIIANSLGCAECPLPLLLLLACQAWVEAMTHVVSRTLVVVCAACFALNKTSAWIVALPAQRKTLCLPQSRRLVLKLGGGVDPPFRWGDQNYGQERSNRIIQPIAMPQAALRANVSASHPPLKLQGFMEGSTKLVPQIGGMPFMSGNCYVDLIVTMTPKEMIAKFKATAPARVQDAVRKTVLRCIGSIQDSLVEDTHRTTGLIFANLLYKAQVTGYMLHNAEVRVTNLLAAPVETPLMGRTQSLLPKGDSVDDVDYMRMEGAIKVVTEDGSEYEVDGQEYVEALRAEAASFRQELSRLECEKRQLLSRDLLSYISELSASQTGHLTSGMTQHVVEAMKMLTNRVLASVQDQPIAESQSMELNSSALAQLIMWGLVTGFSLRELESAWGGYGALATPAALQPPGQPPQQPPKRPRGPPPPPGRGRGRRGPRGGGPPPGRT